MTFRHQLPELFTNCGYERAAEIGVQRGEFSSIILGGWCGTLYMIDAWKHLDGYVDIANVSDDAHENNHQAALKVAQSFSPRGRVIKALSVESAELFSDGYLDAVYLDADHSHEGVLADLAAWVPKVRDGGLVSGHDYVDGNLPEGVFGVASAVNKFFGRSPDFLTDEQWRSWGYFL